MKKVIFIFIYSFLIVIAFGQNKVEKETSLIVDEGKMLYYSEMASWYGTDIFLEKCSSRKANIGGYFSYTDNGISKCIFFSKENIPKVISTISFDKTYNVTTAKLDSSIRNFTTEELDLYTIRKLALVQINSDTLFKKYNGTDLNLIPIITNGEKKVYVLTGPKNNGVVIFGNDYLVNFDKKNNLENKRRIHKNIIISDYGKLQREGKIVTSGFHTHLFSTGDFMTPTDICTLMLYERIAKWEQYTVLSKDYVSIWDCKKDQLSIMTKEAWDKISKINK
jgi:hypothetical protein